MMGRPRFHPVQLKRSSASESSKKHRPADSFSEHSSNSDDDHASLAGSYRFARPSRRHSFHLDLPHPAHTDKATLAALQHKTQKHADLDKFPVYPDSQEDPFGRRVKAFWHDLSATFRTIFVGLMLFAIGTSLDNTTAAQFIPYATSDFHEHSALGIVLTAQAIVLAVSALTFYRLQESLIIGLFWAFVGSIVFYAGGYVLISFSTSIWVYTAGTLVSTVGLAAFVALPSVSIPFSTSLTSYLHIQSLTALSLARKLTIIKYSARLGNNALLNSFLSTPYYVTGWIASFIVEGVISNLGWRWAYRLFCILVPISALPLLVALFRVERQFRLDSRKPPFDPESIPLPDGPALRLGSVRSHASGASGSHLSIAGHHPTLSGHQAAVTELSMKKAAKKGLRSGHQGLRRGGERTKRHLAKLDGIGLFVLAIGLGCLLCPFTLVGQGTFTWTSPVFYVLVAVGTVALLLFPLAERFATSPLFPNGLWRVRRIIITIATTWLNMTSFFLLLAYQYSFIQVMYPSWSPLIQGFFAFSEQFTLTIVHLIASFPMSSLVKKQTTLKYDGGKDRLTTTDEGKKLLRHPMWWLAGSHGVRVLGVGLMILSRRQINGNAGWIFLLVASQVIHGAGGGCASVYNIQIAMAWAPTGDDISMIWALILLVGDVGNAIGTAIATNLWQHFLPLYLRDNLDSLLADEDITAVFSSTETAKSYPQDGEISIAIRTAYVKVMAILLHVALGFAILSFLLSFLIGEASVAEKTDPRIKQRDEWRERRLKGAHQRVELESEEEKTRKKTRDVQPVESRRRMDSEQAALALGKRESRGRRGGRKYRRQYGGERPSAEEEREQLV
ncbi:hypothetical protein JCM11251_000212 [Rhodosporidiobolus azoricus]